MKTLIPGGKGTFVDGPHLELDSHLRDHEKYNMWLRCAEEDCPREGQWVTIDGQRGLVMSVYNLDSRYSNPDIHFYHIYIWVIYEVDVGSVTGRFPVYSVAGPQIKRAKRMVDHDDPCPLAADPDEACDVIDCTCPPIKIILFCG